MQKLILVGYMAVGKTTIAALLAQQTGWEWIDLDDIIQNKTNLSIPEIFKQKGEIFFRKIENEVFKELLNTGEKQIISTGGGTPCYANNHLLLNGENIISIYLQASIDLLFERLKVSKTARPLVANQSDDSLKEFVAKNVFERSYFYNQATYTIQVDNKTATEIVAQIMQILN